MRELLPCSPVHVRELLSCSPGQQLLCSGADGGPPSLVILLLPLGARRATLHDEAAAAAT
jgi:hypothetical protein